MSEHNITVEGGTSVRLPTAGKYCDRDIIVTAEGGGEGGVELPALDNPATKAEVFDGYEYINEAGEKKTGTFTVEEELAAQADKLAELEEVLARKTAGAPATCSVTVVDSMDNSPLGLTYTAYENGAIVTKYAEGPFEWSDEYGAAAVTLANVVAGTSVFVCCLNYAAFDGENIEARLVLEGITDVGLPCYDVKIFDDTTVTITWE